MTTPIKPHYDDHGGRQSAEYVRAVNEGLCCNCGTSILVGHVIYRDERWPADWGWSHVGCASPKPEGESS